MNTLRSSRKDGTILDKDDFKCLDVKVRNMKLQQDSAIAIFKEQLKNKDFLLRDNYKECTGLMLILLGEIPDRGVHWRKLGAFHHARWMSFVIYAAKMYLFRDSMGYNEETTLKLRDIYLFNALVYVKHWLVCSVEVDAPFNDLTFQ